MYKRVLYSCQYLARRQLDLALRRWLSQKCLPFDNKFKIGHVKLTMSSRPLPFERSIPFSIPYKDERRCFRTSIISHEVWVLRIYIYTRNFTILLRKIFITRRSIRINEQPCSWSVLASSSFLRCRAAFAFEHTILVDQERYREEDWSYR